MPIEHFSGRSFHSPFCWSELSGPLSERWFQQCETDSAFHSARIKWRSHAQQRAQLQNSRTLQVVGESAALKAGLQLMSMNEGDVDARLTLEDLREICEAIGVDFLLVSSVEGRPLAGVTRRN